MFKQDAEKIIELQKQGYQVVVKNPWGNKFLERYSIYQSVGFKQLKIAICDEQGRVSGAQG